MVAGEVKADIAFTFYLVNVNCDITANLKTCVLPETEFGRSSDTTMLSGHFYAKANKRMYLTILNPNTTAV